MKEPSKEELRKFWEWLGFGMKYLPYGLRVRELNPNEDNPLDEYTLADPNKCKIADYPKLTLDNLFKYAVPKVKQEIPELQWAKLFVDWLQDILYDDKDPAITLFYTLFTIFEKQKN